MRLTFGPLAVVSLSFILYILTAFLADDNSAKILYLKTFLIVGIVWVYLCFCPQGIRFSRNLVLFSSVILIVAYISVFPLAKQDIYLLTFCVYLITVAVFFSNSRIEEHQFVTLINGYYCLYFLISLALWLEAVPNPNANEFLIKDEFRVTLFGLNYYVLPGIEGSPAYIDSYSALIFLLNLFVGSGKYRKTAIIFSILGIILSLRLTPIVSIFILFLMTPIIKNRLLFLSFNLVVFSAFVLTVILVISNVRVFILEQEVDVSLIAYVLTHARSMIWEQQLILMFNEYHWHDYIFGGYDVSTFMVPTFQLSGTETGRFQSNPHNTFLLLFFRSPLLAVLLFMLVIWKFMKSIDAKYFIPVSFVLLACYTNSGIIGLENPVYLYVMAYAISDQKRSAHIRKRIFADEE